MIYSAPKITELFSKVVKKMSLKKSPFFQEHQTEKAVAVTACSPVSEGNVWRDASWQKSRQHKRQLPSWHFFSWIMPLSLCVCLLGCDSQSSTASVLDASVDNQAASDSMLKNLVSPQGLENEEQAVSTVAETDNEQDDTDSDGQSLITSAQSNDAVRKKNSPMFASKRDKDSTLEATLIGDYTGILPCDSCDSIAMTLNLFSDGSVRKTSIYNHVESQRAPVVESGVYRQDDNLITIVYDDITIEMYQIQDNHLLMLDEDKQPDADFTLSRI